MNTAPLGSEQRAGGFLVGFLRELGSLGGERFALVGADTPPQRLFVGEAQNEHVTAVLAVWRAEEGGALVAWQARDGGNQTPRPLLVVGLVQGRITRVITAVAGHPRGTKSDRRVASFARE